MPYRLEPHVAGELGEASELDPSVHPPIVTAVEYLLDAPDPDDLIESFPIFLVSAALATRLDTAGLTGFVLRNASVRPSSEYLATYGEVPHSKYRWMRLHGDSPTADAWLDGEHRLCVSDRMMAVLRSHRLARCIVESV
jgi:hypothetical protein